MPAYGTVKAQAPQPAHGHCALRKRVLTGQVQRASIDRGRAIKGVAAGERQRAIAILGQRTAQACQR